MPADDDDNLDRRVRKLAVEHAETRWLTLRLDDDVKELREDLGAARATQDQHTETLQEHTTRFDSVDAQLRSLTQMVGQVLDRLPEQNDGK
jgi:uncharacterized coiled-coil DUF342 family protein